MRLRAGCSAGTPATGERVRKDGSSGGFEDNLCRLDEKESVGSGPWRKWLSWSLVVAILLWAIARTFGFERGYPFVQLMAFTPYVLLISLLTCLLVVLLRQWLAFIVGAIGVVALAIAVVPRELGGPEDAPPGEPIRMLSFNTFRGNADYTELLEIIEARDINVLSLQELPVNGAKRLKRRGIEDTMPFRVLGVEENKVDAHVGG